MHDHEYHEHKFVIPVEWQYYGREYYGDGSAAHFKGAQVSTLRCECGEEIERAPKSPEPTKRKTNDSMYHVNKHGSVFGDDRF